MFNALTPLNHENQSGPNFCPFCEYWSPVASIVTGHVRKEHRARLGETSGQLRGDVERQFAAAARAAKVVAIKERKAARDKARHE